MKQGLSDSFFSTCMRDSVLTLRPRPYPAQDNPRINNDRLGW